MGVACAVPINVNSLCESQSQCPSIPAKYFNQDFTTANPNTGDGGGDVLVAVSSFFAAYAVLFISFAIFTMYRNKTTTSKYKTPMRVIILTITILIETFDVLTDIGQTSNIMKGMKCGQSSCYKQDKTLAYIMMPCVAIGSIATIIGLYTFCKKTGLNSTYGDTDKEEEQLNKCDCISNYMKIWGENIPISWLILYWMWVSGGVLQRYGYFTSTLILSVFISAFNFYWLIIPILCSCCCNRNHDDNPQPQQTAMELGAAHAQPSQPQQIEQQLSISNEVIPLQTVQQPSHATEALPAGWSSRVDPNGRVYYQNDLTHTTQWEKPTAEATVTVQQIPTMASFQAPRPMQQQPQYNNNVQNVVHNSATYDEKRKSVDGMTCFGRFCMWCGCVCFSGPLLLLWVIYMIFVAGGVTSIGQVWNVVSVDNECLVFKNFNWIVDDIYSNVTRETYEFSFWSSTDDFYPILQTGVNEWLNEAEQEVGCRYTPLPEPGQCFKFLFLCDAPYYIEYNIDELCADWCSA